MLTTKENSVRIEGILSEIDLKRGTFMKDNKTVNSIGGVIKIRVNQKINGVDTELEVPVHMFASEFKNDGGSNPAYESISRVMTEFTSIAASDIDSADRVRITRAQVTMNEYYSQGGKLISFPRVTASFVTKIKKEECNPDASGTIVFMVGDKKFETDKDGVETNKYMITGLVPQYGGKIDVIPFYAINPGVIDGVSSSWNEGDTVRAAFKLNFTSRTETRMVEVDFGEPTEETRTVSVSELIITGGSATPLEGDFAIDANDVQAALADRKARLAALKEKANTRGTSGKAPAAANNGNKFKDLGF